MSKKEDIKKSYKDEKQVSIREILTKSTWKIDEVIYNSKTGKYDFKASNDDGRTVEVSRNKQYVDNLLDELEND